MDKRSFTIRAYNIKEPSKVVDLHVRIYDISTVSKLIKDGIVNKETILSIDDVDVNSLNFEKLLDQNNSYACTANCWVFDKPQTFIFGPFKIKYVDKQKCSIDIRLLSGAKLILQE